MSEFEDAKIVEKYLPCNCDLDRWEPTKSTGHSPVCRIHKIVLGRAIDYGALARRLDITREYAIEIVADIRTALAQRREGKEKCLKR